MKKSDKPNTDQSVRIAGDVVQMARTLVAMQGGTMSDCISDLVRPLIRRKLEEAIEQGKAFPPPKKK